MFNISNFVPRDHNLAKAGALLLIEIVAFVAFSLLLSGFGLDAEKQLFVSLLLFNLAPAYFLCMAAKSRNRSALAFGLTSLIPAGALFSFFVLRNDELFS